MKIVMKKAIRLLLMGLSMCFSISEVYADSPLTSTEFYKAYENLPKLENGSDEMYAYLANDSVALEYRLAVINKASWRIECDWTRAAEFVGYLSEVYGAHDIDSIFEAMSGMQMACLAYLLAMDDYFHVEGALSFAQEAVKRCPKSYAVNMVEALIIAQVAVDDMDNWCYVYRATDRVRQNKNLEMDMNENAAKIIFAYLDEYKKYCK